MSNWTHINCNVVGTFNEQKIEKLFGKPILDWKMPYQYAFGSKKWKKVEKLLENSYNQSKLPCGEVPLNYILRKPPTYKKEIDVYGVDEDVLTIWGDLRDFEMSNEEHFKQIEEIVNKLFNSDSSIRSFILQAHEEYSGKTYIWSSSFDCYPTLTIIDKENEKREIKFRYYDFNDKEMYYNVQSCYDYGHIGPNIAVESFGELLRDIASGIVKGELMQFTGLYDKNGKEIYEGDIISANHYPFVDNNKQNYVGVIEYIPELASFQYILNCVNPDKNGISNGINEQLEVNENLILEDFEVIGNIYDNPELIGE